MFAAYGSKSHSIVEVQLPQSHHPLIIPLSLHWKVRSLRNENLVPNDFIYEDMLTVDDNIAVMGGLITDEVIVQYIIEVLEEEVREDAEETNETLTKPMTEEIRKAINTLVSFSMFTRSGEIGKIAMKKS